MPSGWNGRGNPPSKAAALAWLEAQGVNPDTLGPYWIPRNQAWKQDANNLGAVGAQARRLAAERKRSSQKARTRVAEGRVDRRSGNNDGRATAAETQKAAETGAVGGDDLEAIIGQGPQASSGKGAPLLPYAIPADMDPTSLRFDNRSRNSKGGGAQIGPRYYEADTLGPLRWSPEKRAQLQRDMMAIGLYGDKKIRLGSWSAADQGALAELLTYANVEGRGWEDQLRHWKRTPPEELLSQIRGDQPAKPTLQVTNPIDIRTAGEQTSRALIGRVDRGFAEGAVGGYQEQEKSAQLGVVGDQEAGGGGTITREASLEGYLQDKLRREQPLEVDGYAFLGAFESFIDMLQGGA